MVCKHLTSNESLKVKVPREDRREPRSHDRCRRLIIRGIKDYRRGAREENQYERCADA